MSRPKIEPSGRPQGIPKRNVGQCAQAWYYESRRGVEVYHQQRDAKGVLVSASIVRIPWRKLMKSAARCGWTVRFNAPKQAKR